MCSDLRTSLGLRQLLSRESNWVSTCRCPRHGRQLLWSSGWWGSLRALPLVLAVQGEGLPMWTVDPGPARQSLYCETRPPATPMPPGGIAGERADPLGTYLQLRKPRHSALGVPPPPRLVPHIALENKSHSCQRKAWLGDSRSQDASMRSSTREKSCIGGLSVTPCGFCLGHVILFHLAPLDLSFYSSFSVGPLKVVVIRMKSKMCPVLPQTTLAMVYCNKITSYICRHSSGVILFFPPHIYI